MPFGNNVLLGMEQCMYLLFLADKQGALASGAVGTSLNKIARF